MKLEIVRSCAGAATLPMPRLGSRAEAERGGRNHNNMMLSATVATPMAM